MSCHLPASQRLWDSTHQSGVGRQPLPWLVWLVRLMRAVVAGAPAAPPPSDRCDGIAAEQAWRRGSLDTGSAAADIGRMPPTDPYLTTREVADALGVTTERVRQLIRARQLRASVRRTGTRSLFRIRRSDLDDYLAGHVLDSFRDDWE